MASTTGHVLTVRSASGKDVILVETVGVGQDEVEIVETADVSVVVLVPGLGDEVQALKAGIMEIADVFVVNKADREGVERIVAEIETMLSLAAHDAPRPAIVKTVATVDQGVDELLTEIEAFRARADQDGALAHKRQAHARLLLHETLQDPLMRLVRSRVCAAEVDRLVKVAAGSRSVRRCREILRTMGLMSRPLKIDHLGIAVPSLEEAIRAYRASGSGRGRPRGADRAPGRLPPIGESRLSCWSPPTLVGGAKFLRSARACITLCSG